MLPQYKQNGTFLGHLGQTIGLIAAILVATQDIINTSSCWYCCLVSRRIGQNIREQDFWSVYSTTDLLLDVWVSVGNKNMVLKSKYMFYNDKSKLSTYYVFYAV